MRSLLAGVFLALLPAWGWLAAEEEGERIVFAAPEIEGTYSLGVFDKSGKLVRVLHVDAPKEDFRIGDNGLITYWDRRLEDGKQAPAGVYSVRGYAIGEVDIEGVAFHGNDWLQGAPGVRVTEICAIAATPEGLAVLGRTAEGSGQVIDCDAGGNILRVVDVPANGGLVQGGRTAARFLLTTAGTDIVVSVGMAAYVLPAAETAFREPMLMKSAPWVILGRGSGVFAAEEHRITEYELSRFDVARELESPVPVAVMAFSGTELVVGEKDGEAGMVILREGKWLPLAGLVSYRVQALAGLPDGGFWMVAEEKGQSLLAQADAKGEIRQFLRAEEGFQFLDVAASPHRRLVYVLDRKGDHVRVRGIEPVAPDVDEENEWSEVFVLSIRNRQDVLEELRKEVGKKPVSVKLIENTLDPSASRTTRLLAGESGLIVDSEGLPLFRAADGASREGNLLSAGAKNGEARFFSADDMAVREYAIRGLENLVRIDAGTIEIER